MARFATMVLSSAQSSACKRALNCMTCSAITSTNKNSMNCSVGGTENMSETPSTFKPKKSVALSGVTAGNTALSTVGRTGNDLHYRGYDILDIANRCEFEEIAYLLVHEE